MLNETLIIGVVAGKSWRHNGDVFQRVAVYREAGRPTKPAPPSVPGRTTAPDYVTVRLMGGMLNGAPITLAKGQSVLIRGYLASRDEQLTLAEFASQIEGKRPAIPEELLSLSIQTYRLDLIPEKIVLLGSS